VLFARGKLFLQIKENKFEIKKKTKIGLIESLTNELKQELPWTA
jgi:hypothetical protein